VNKILATKEIILKNVLCKRKVIGTYISTHFSNNKQAWLKPVSGLLAVKLA
jgi:hypothetical protein